ncbi:chemotaxis protein CheW [Lamprocystis purpurea]|uniref:chemotaxis protein CheW n=1 Tax=Lamprocystis purpurea TaxID=61598 RepID=UPI00036B1AD0|nr:chemotaxis protein CheW [Lamprocystis purpurea]
MEALLFTAGGGPYLAPLSDLDEVLMPARLRPLAQAPVFLAGVLDLRGATLPVLDLAERLGRAGPAPAASQGPAGRRWQRGNRILCFSAAGVSLGAIVESVTGIRTLSADARREPVLTAAGAPAFLGDLWPVDGRLTQELRLSCLLEPAELALLQGTAVDRLA